MDQKTYYVSVQAGTAVENKGDTSFEFEITATEKQMAKLQEMFEALDDAEDSTFLRGMTPAIPYHQDMQNDDYDQALIHIYQLIHELGTPDTKKHIAQMGVLANIT